MEKKIRHNFDPRKVAQIFREELVRTLNESADLLAGAEVGAGMVGIASVFTHNSSPPNKPAPAGGPPGVRTGTLRRSFRSRPVYREGKTVRTAAGTNVPYGRKHQFGIGVPARPFMEQGIADSIPHIQKVIDAAPARIRRRIQATKGPVR